MTRGNFVLITDDRILVSCQFNGDMYPEGNGTAAYALLEKTGSEERFEAAVEAFRAMYFPEYEDTDIHEVPDLDFSDDYYKRFNSDYLYIKNIGSNEARIRARTTGDVANIAPAEIQVWYYGDPKKVDFDSMSQMQMFRMLGRN